MTHWFNGLRLRGGVDRFGRSYACYVRSVVWLFRLLFLVTTTMALRGDACLVRAPAAPVNMVASSNGPPALPLAGSRSIQSVLAIALFVTMSDTASNSAHSLPLFSKERPAAETVQDWLKLAKPLLSHDETAIVDGDTPRTLIQYRDATVPAVLALDAGAGIGARDVAHRDMQIQSVADANAVKLDQRRSHLS